MTRPSGHAAIVSPGPLSGIRALELAEIWAGPFCGSLLADMGAEVIKVEAIQRIARGSIRPGPGASGYPDGEPGERPWNRNANFNVLSRNKQGITLDLTTPDGADTFKELVNVSDVVFTNYAFGVMDKFGLDYEELRKVKPDVIALFTPGYGNTGPYRTFRSMGMVIDAITGHTALRGYPDMDVSRNSLVHHPDAVAGATAVFSICLAIHNRARTGKGQFIDLSQAEAFMPHLGEVFLEHSIVGRLEVEGAIDTPGWLLTARTNAPVTTSGLRSQFVQMRSGAGCARRCRCRSSHTTPSLRRCLLASATRTSLT